MARWNPCYGAVCADERVRPVPEYCGGHGVHRAAESVNFDTYRKKEILLPPLRYGTTEERARMKEGCPMDAIHTLLTETNNPATAGISGCSTLEMLRLINDEDK